MKHNRLLALPTLVLSQIGCSSTENTESTSGTGTTSATLGATSAAGPSTTSAQTSGSSASSTSSTTGTVTSTASVSSVSSVGGASSSASVTTNTVATSETASSTGGSSTTGSLDPGICDNEQRDGDETGIDCGGSCPECVSYETAPPDPEYVVESGCGTGFGGGDSFMCPRSMVFSPEMIQAAFHDWGMDDPPFVYGVVGHDPDVGGVDESPNTCCQCYQLVFESTGVAGITSPKSMIVQSFNVYAGGAKSFDIFMAAGGLGNFNGCYENNQQYETFPSEGSDWFQGGVRATRYSQCSAADGVSVESLAAPACQDYVKSQCDMITSVSPEVQAGSQQSCVWTNRAETLYHTNWSVYVKRVECPEALTRVTGCKLAPQGLPEANPAVQTVAQAQADGFLGGYGTTTMQDCCRPHCAWDVNVAQNGASVDAQYNRFYSCGHDGVPH